MNIKKIVALLGCLALLFILSVSLAEAVSVTPKALSGEMRIITPDGKSVVINQAGQAFDLVPDSRIEIISGKAILQIAGYLVKIQEGEAIAVKIASQTGEINLSVLLGNVEIESQQQAWLLNQGETAILPKTDIAVASGEKQVVGATEGEVTSDKVAPKVPDGPSLPVDNLPGSRLAMPVLAAPVTIIVKTPIPSPQPVKYASPSAP